MQVLNNVVLFRIAELLSLHYLTPLGARNPMQEKATANSNSWSSKNQRTRRVRGDWNHARSFGELSSCMLTSRIEL